MFQLIGRIIHWLRSNLFLPKILESWLRILRALCAFSLPQAKISFYSSDITSVAAEISLQKWIKYARTTSEIYTLHQEAQRRVKAFETMLQEMKEEEG